MKIRVRRFDKELPLPTYATEGAAAMDCYARETTTIPPGEVRYIPLNIALEIPEGHFVLMAARSSLHKKGLMLANGIGILDEDYCGDDDEYKAAVFNFSSEIAEVNRGDRITQIIVRPVERFKWTEVDSLERESRGGFGSTGKSV